MSTISVKVKKKGEGLVFSSPLKNFPARREVAVSGGVLFDPSEGAASGVLDLQESFIHTSITPLKLLPIMVALLLAFFS